MRGTKFAPRVLAMPLAAAIVSTMADAGLARPAPRPMTRKEARMLDPSPVDLLPQLRGPRLTSADRDALARAEERRERKRARNRRLLEAGKIR